MTAERLSTPGTDPALDPALAARDGHTQPLEAIPGDGPAPTGGEAPATPAPEAGSSYVDQSREAFRDATEAGRAFARNVGRSAVSRVVRRGAGESSGTGDGSAEGTTEARKEWGERAKDAKARVMTRLEDRWADRQKKRQDEKLDRQAIHAQNKVDRHDRRVQRKMDKIDDKLDLEIHKRTMTRKDFRKYKLNKQIQKDVAKANAASEKYRKKQEAKAFDKGLKIEAKNEKSREKAKAARLAVDIKTAHRMNRRFDQNEASKLKAEEMRRRLANPEAWATEKAERRKARIAHARKVGGKVLRGADVATKVAVGTGVIGGETAAKVIRGGAEAVRNDERARYLKMRAELGWAAVRKTLGDQLAIASERLLSNRAEQNAIDHGEMPITDNAEVSVDLHPEGENTDDGERVLTNA